MTGMFALGPGRDFVLGVTTIVAAGLLASATPATAQQAGQQPVDTNRAAAVGKPVRLPAVVVVTATRTPKQVFDAPVPVTVIDSALIRERAPNNAADLFRDQPGLDVTGVGTNQTRPAIRGQRGQRILLLQDGLRLNNSRRQQDFGELPAIVDLNEIARIEVVRGPASVLYGTDAIGGVVNLITRDLPARGDGGVHGRLAYLVGDADGQQRPSGMLEQRVGRFAYRVSGMYRSTDDYQAPAGTLGNILLRDDARVFDTGVRDASYAGAVGFDISASQRVVARYEHYEARDAGFGYVDPRLLGADQPLIQIRYPSQDVDRYSLSYHSTALGSLLADRVEVTAHALDNDRRLTLDVFIPFGGRAPPGSGVQSNSANYTDLFTLGMRAEATKILGTRHLLTYGIDAFQDRSNNRDSSRTVVVGFPGPPPTDTSTRAQVPNASFLSAGAFAQGDFRLAEPLSLVIGVRAQDIVAKTRRTEGLDGSLVESHDRTVVGTANVLYRLTRDFHLVASVGRGFRSPNLVERFFDGPTPEGSGYQVLNTGLKPEKSVNVDLGARYRVGPLYAEAFGFRNTLRDGIRIRRLEGDSVSGLAAYQNVNIDRLRFDGAEALVNLDLAWGFSTSGSYSRVYSKDVLNPNNPVASGYASKLVGELAYRAPSGRFWSSYVVRHNGQQKDGDFAAGPIGPVLPAFTVHSFRGGADVFVRGGVRGALALGVDNLTNELYAESSNASFFRPQPQRSVTASWVLGF